MCVRHARGGRGWWSVRAMLVSARRDEMTRDPQSRRVDLDERIVHHAGRIVARAGRIEPRPVRHQTRLNAFDLRHRRRFDDRDG